MTQQYREVVTGAHPSLVNLVLAYCWVNRLARAAVRVEGAWKLKRVVLPDQGHDRLLGPALDFALEPDSERLRRTCLYL